MNAEKILLSSPLFQKDLCFKAFGDDEQEIQNSSLDVIANTMKLMGNSGCGGLNMNVEKHQNIHYLKGTHV